MANRFDQGRYSNMTLDDLIVFAMSNIAREGQDCTLERLVYECYTLFPKSFSFARYPQWPDSNKLDRPVRTLREKGFIVGSPKVGFSLTDYGCKKADDVARRLGSEKHEPTRKKTTLKGKEMAVIAYLKSSEHYKRFQEDKETFSVSKSQLIDLLRATLVSSLINRFNHLTAFARICSAVLVHTKG